MTVTPDVEPANLIYLDLFPAKVSKDGAILGEEYRVIVTDNHLYVLDEVIGGVAAIVKEPLTLFAGSNKEGYTVTTSENVYYIVRAQNCGCGSRLRGYSVFSGVPHEFHLRK